MCRVQKWFFEQKCEEKKLLWILCFLSSHNSMCAPKEYIETMAKIESRFRRFENVFVSYFILLLCFVQLHRFPGKMADRRISREQKHKRAFIKYFKYCLISMRNFTFYKSITSSSPTKHNRKLSRSREYRWKSKIFNNNCYMERFFSFSLFRFLDEKHAQASSINGQWINTFVCARQRDCVSVDSRLKVYSEEKKERSLKHCE